MKTKLKSILAVALCAVGLSAFAEPEKQEISAVSAEGWIDLTVGDRVAKDEETIVVDPAWGEAKTAKVQIDGESSARTYTCASNDVWNTKTALVAQPGRYQMKLTAGTLEGEAAYTAAFWKTGADWVVFDSSNITADVTFEADKTYLMLGTNTVDATLTVTDGAKFAYGEGAGFKGGTVAELPKRYGKKTVGDLYQIYEKIKGSKDNPWEVGVGVEAYTNGNELVISGTGMVTGLSEIPAEVKDGILLTLPDNWLGELPDKDGNWYDARNVELTRWPMAVKNVKILQRYPWNGLVDVKFALTGEGKVAVTLSVTTNGVKAVENPTVTGETTFDLGGGSELKDLRLTWDAKADFGDEALHQKIKVKLTVEKVEAD